MNLTDEQASILDFGKTDSGNLMVNAYAGTGKTTTIEQVARVAKQSPIMYLVFNKRNADEAVERMPGHVTVKTFNGLGHGIWASAVGKKLKLNTKKTYEIFKSIADEVKGPAAKAIWDSYEQVKFGVEMAKALGYVPDGVYSNATRLITQSTLQSRLDEEPDDLVTDLIDGVLKRSIKLSYDGEIDFNDQIYMSALFGGTYPKFPLTLVDEYQDLNPCNHEMIRKLVGNRRLIGVGDRHQNIYGFRGAKLGGMDEAVGAFKMNCMDLSISFRCPEAIVRNSRWHVPKFNWFKEGGHVESLSRLDSADIPDNATFLCRLNAPLFALAMRLLGAGHSVSVAGTDIGPRLVAIMKKFGDDSMTRDEVLSCIAEWETIKLEKESKTATDMANCMRVFAHNGANLRQAIGYAEHLFSQRGAIRLMTGHKSKGLEFPLTYHLDPQVIGDGTQDKNLRYVIETRTTDTLYQIRSEDIIFDGGPL